MTGSTKTLSGQLEIGVEFDGKLHRDFTLRLPTVGDEIDVAEDESVPESGFRVAIFARCLTALGSIPAKQLSYKLLRDELDSGDFGILIKAAEELKKKRKSANVCDITSAVPVSGSDATGSVKPTSSASVL
ncbi:hypothetical protein NG99_04580 [Erwinia typographi]|uniref:Mu-like prophage FluMu gp41 family protein n=1 Tax=Erwinia typographi TaxID=371042 RepID=A0A0A3Z8V1_9GAMM|nr:phage tail assembly protein [Erwinia typographi]KGT95300.1 hypothetical protein NG99_04580 [Erwinia typographi]